MKMYTLADKAISPEEFIRAVSICTGRQLSQHVVKTVFQVRNQITSDTYIVVAVGSSRILIGKQKTDHVQCRC